VENNHQDETAQVERILHSNALRESDSLARLLRYLAVHSDSAVKEYQIATEVFGRPSDWDPRLDSSVRVQIARLRSKLIEYASGEGAQDPFVLDIPRGSYRVSFTPRGSKELWGELQVSRSDRESATPPIAPPNSSNLASLGWKRTALVLGFLLLTALAWIIGARPAHQESTLANPPTGEALRAFWKPFTSTRDETWLIFSNAMFAGRPDTGLHYYRAKVDPPESALDLYTGVGEVLAVHELDKLFAGLGKSLRVKRGALLSLDDIRGKNLIFVGSPVENLPLNDIHVPGEFRFQVLTQGPQQGEVQIVNVHPKPGEPVSFMKQPQVPQLDDYAIISKFRGADPQHWTVIAAGTSTVGTQAAVEFLCSENSLPSLQEKLGTGRDHPFQAALHVKISHGVPIDTEIVALRVIP
jgi:hypothetical protein